MLTNQSMEAANNVTSANNTSTGVEKFSLALSSLSFTFLILILIMALFGNTLVIVAFVLYSKLKTVTNYFVVSLAISDVWIAVFSMTIWAAFLLTGPSWMFGQSLYRLWLCNDILCGVASIINLAAISLERYVCITYPLNYHIHMTHKKAIFIIIAIWLFAFGMASVKLTNFEWERPNYELLVTILCFFLPLMVICNSYRLIFKTARYQARQIAMMVNGGVRNFLLASEVRAAKTLGVVMGAFVICWSPFFVLNLVYGVCQSCKIPEEAIMATKWMHYCNSVFNPIVYACMNKEYRHAFWSILINGKARLLRMQRGSSAEQSELSERTLNTNRLITS